MFTNYDSTFILSSAILWIMFGYLGKMMSCDLIKALNNPIILHIVGLISFFFLFAVVNNNSGNHIGYIWVKTIISYILFIMLGKTKWYFTIPVIVMLMVDQSLKLQCQYYQDTNDSYDPAGIDGARTVISYVIYGLIVTGFITYVIKQWGDHGEGFSWNKMLLSFGCQGTNKSSVVSPLLVGIN